MKKGITKVILSSVSDCREKTGIATFMKIFELNKRIFNSNGIEPVVMSYINFPKSDNVTNIDPASINSKSNKPHKFKKIFKSFLLKRALSAFLLLLFTIVIRGLIVAIRAKVEEKKGQHVVHFYQDVFTAYFGPFIHSKDSKKVLILHSGGDALNHLFTYFSALKNTIYESLIRKKFIQILTAQDIIIVLSNHHKKILQEKFPEHNIVCIYNTSPFETINNYVYRKCAQDIIEIIAVGSLQYIKGFDLLIDSIVRMNPIHRNKFHINILGSGPLHSELQEKIEKNDLNSVISLLGVVTDVSHYLQQSDIYILTSRDEGFPISLIEACACSLPIITTRVGSIPEVFRDEDCIFIDTTMESVQFALEEVFNNPSKLNLLSENSKRVYDQNLSTSAFIKRYIEVLK